MGKWKLHRFYHQDANLRRYLPETALYSLATLTKFLHRYSAVYIKPDHEHTGKGIIKAWKLNKGYTFIKVRGQSSKIQPSIRSLYRRMGIMAKSPTFVVQKAIPLASVKERPFDIRVMMMRHAKGSWMYVGMLAKVAGTQSVVTNIKRGGGYVMSVPDALDATGRIRKARIQNMTKQLISVSKLVCQRFNRYKYSRQIGVDYGIDVNGRLWIIEVNFDFPSHALFLGLKDKSVYRQIKAIKASWNRRG
jgi:uncharacterized circularly permuted ATP-grasp superfamily protein